MPKDPKIGPEAAPGDEESGLPPEDWLEAPETPADEGLPSWLSADLPDFLRDEMASATEVLPEVPAFAPEAPEPVESFPSSVEVPVEVPVAAVEKLRPLAALGPGLHVEKFARSTPRVPPILKYGTVVRNPCAPLPVCACVQHRLPRGMRLLRTDPPATSEGVVLTWDLNFTGPDVPQRVTLWVQPDGSDATDHANGADFRVSYACQAPVAQRNLEVTLNGPGVIRVGDSAEFLARLTNHGALSLPDSALHFLLPPGLRHARGDSVAVEVGPLGPGESAHVRLITDPAAVGKQCVRVWATVGGALEGSSQAEIQVTAPALRLVLDGPPVCRLQQSADFLLRLSNPGDAAAKTVEVACSLPEGIELVSTDAAGRYDPDGRRVRWFLDSLPDGPERVLALRLRAAMPGDYTHQATAIAERGLRAEATLSVSIEPDGTSTLLDEVLAEIEGEELVAPAPAPATPKRGGREHQHILFSLAGTDYAVPIVNVLEIGQPLDIRAVPNVPDWVLGVANVRGDIVSMVDLRRFLGLEINGQLPARRMLVCRARTGELTTGLLVDRVHGIRALSEQAVVPPPSGVDQRVAPYLRGVADHDGRLLVYLDMDRLLLSAEMRQFEPV
jgi:purine-binding chemotaxis protein CheW